MMRSMYSAVAGLRAHQTKMDVIGNNIANVNTTGFKASNVVFSDVYYQTLQSATGANSTTGAAGQNARQIGLGSKLTSITPNMTTQGGAQATDNAMDIMLSGDSFFIVNSAGQTCFTKAGAFGVDAVGNLCTSSGALVMGWESDDAGEIVRGQVKKLAVMGPDYLYSSPAATTETYLSGNIDATDTKLAAEGVPFTVNFYDNLGYSYTAVFAIKQTDAATATYEAELTDVLDADSKSILVTETPGTGGGASTFAASTAVPSVDGTAGTIAVDTLGKVTSTGVKFALKFNTVSGKFESVGASPATDPMDPKYGIVNLSIAGSEFPTEGIRIDFSSLTQYSTNGTSSVASTRGNKLNGAGAGTAFGNLKGIAIGSDGIISGTYDNGTKRVLGQIAVATFSNPSGLEAVGDRMFVETVNSGTFDGIGQDVVQGGGSMLSGYLEMSNVDLSNEFTNLITTQRGFQANSRIITTSDSLLEELVNLKR